MLGSTLSLCIIIEWSNLWDQAKESFRVCKNSSKLAQVRASRSVLICTFLPGSNSTSSRCSTVWACDGLSCVTRLPSMKRSRLSEILVVLKESHGKLMTNSLSPTLSSRVCNSFPLARL
ncbi:hypothetical protein CJ030_MR8G002085 [Morella rubra]|uniref:Uncharacterized protein n=1 Tax=Morella rubra TaxID=262757 RepID=A0A6A1UV17_9ROSI|nr:hypothetical protein CJ030_MR8G002085 [Morella rubra]